MAKRRTSTKKTPTKETPMPYNSAQVVKKSRRGRPPKNRKVESESVEPVRVEPVEPQTTPQHIPSWFEILSPVGNIRKFAGWTASALSLSSDAVSNVDDEQVMTINPPVIASPMLTSRSGPSSPARKRPSRRHSITNYTRNSAKAVFSKKWMRQAVRWDFVGVSLSKMWGKINSRPLPVWARKPIYKTWGTLFRCDMDEVAEPLHHYPTLAHFFARELKPGAREICKEGMSSPVDGRVLAVGEISSDLVEQIKGKTYSMSSFLGTSVNALRKKAKQDCKDHNLNPNIDEEETTLHQVIIYLSPGDYHRIHFPVSCEITKRRHFPGTLFPVNKPFLRLIPSLFALNERVVLLGDWEHGFFSMTAVGAYNVGSIELNFDDILKTNHLVRDYKCANLEYFSWSGVGSHSYERDYQAEGRTVVAEKGDEAGQFKFGSTVVLVFEATKDFKFTVEPGSYLRMGEQIGYFESDPDASC